MSRGNKKAGQRRLVDMSPQVADGWLAELEPVHEEQSTIPIDESRYFIIRCSYDKYRRLCDWAVIQMRNTEDGARRVAEYDASHQKSVHVHIYDSEGFEIDEHPLHRPVRSYSDLEDGLDYAVERVSTDWLENERRSDRGRDRGQ